MDNSGRAYSEV